MDFFVTDYKANRPADALCAVLEDSIMHKGRPVTAGSKMLESFISPIDAEAVSRLEANNITILGKTKMDEFGWLTDCGTPIQSGAVEAVAEGVADFALCNDYTGSVRLQAARRGLHYIHPTYGTVSRYGLIPAVPSMDQIGIVCKSHAAGFEILSKLAGNDPKDGAMLPGTSYSYSPDRNGVKIGVPVNVFSQTFDKTPISDFVKKFDTVDFELKYFGVYSQVMYILACAEFSNNISRYDGIKFGHRTDSFRDLDELYTKSRTEAFGTDVKLAAIMGAMVLSQENYTRYYDKAMRIRRLIKESLEFDKYDVIILPTEDSNPDKQRALHALTQLAGLPSITIPHGGGVQLIADVNNENTLFSAMEAVK